MSFGTFLAGAGNTFQAFKDAQQQDAVNQATNDLNQQRLQAAEIANQENQVHAAALQRDWDAQQVAADVTRQYYQNEGLRRSLGYAPSPAPALPASGGLNTAGVTQTPAAGGLNPAPLPANSDFSQPRPAPGQNTAGVPINVHAADNPGVIPSSVDVPDARALASINGQLPASASPWATPTQTGSALKPASAPAPSAAAPVAPAAAPAGLQTAAAPGQPADAGGDAHSRFGYYSALMNAYRQKGFYQQADLIQQGLDKLQTEGVTQVARAVANGETDGGHLAAIFNNFGVDRVNPQSVLYDPQTGMITAQRADGTPLAINIKQFAQRAGLLPAPQVMNFPESNVAVVSDGLGHVTPVHTPSPEYGMTRTGDYYVKKYGPPGVMYGPGSTGGSAGKRDPNVLTTPQIAAGTSQAVNNFSAYMNHNFPLTDATTLQPIKGAADQKQKLSEIAGSLIASNYPFDDRRGFVQSPANVLSVAKLIAANPKLIQDVNTPMGPAKAVRITFPDGRVEQFMYTLPGAGVVSGTAAQGAAPATNGTFSATVAPQGLSAPAAAAPAKAARAAKTARAAPAAGGGIDPLITGYTQGSIPAGQVNAQNMGQYVAQQNAASAAARQLLSVFNPDPEGGVMKNSGSIAASSPQAIQRINTNTLRAALNANELSMNQKAFIAGELKRRGVKP